MSLVPKVNIRKGWPNPSIVDTVLPPATGVTTLEAGMVGRRNYDSPEGWVLGVSSQFQEPVVFMNDQGDPDADRGAHAGGYVQMSVGGIRGVSLDNPLEIETVQYAQYGDGIDPAPGDLLYAHTDGKLYVGRTADGDVISESKVLLAVVHRGPFMIGENYYISWAPLKARLLSDVSGTGPDNA